MVVPRNKLMKDCFHGRPIPRKVLDASWQPVGNLAKHPLNAVLLFELFVLRKLASLQEKIYVGGPGMRGTYSSEIDAEGFLQTLTGGVRVCRNVKDRLDVAAVAGIG